MITFGLDLVIREGAHKTYKNKSELGHSYELPSEDILYRSSEAISYLAGSNKFKVNQLEVFKVILKH